MNTHSFPRGEGPADPTRFVARIIRDFLAELLKAPNVPIEVGRVAPRRYKRRAYPAKVSQRIGPAIAGLNADGIIRQVGSQGGSIAAASSKRTARRAGLSSLWTLADPATARAKVKALNKLLRDKPQPKLFD